MEYFQGVEMGRKRGVGIGYFEVCNGVRQREERLT